MKNNETKKVVIEVEYPATLTNEDIIASVNKMNILYINAGYTARLISPDKQGLKDKIIGKSFGLNGNGDKSAIYLKDLFHIIDTMPDPKDLPIIASFDKQGLKDAISRTYVDWLNANNISSSNLVDDIIKFIDTMPEPKVLSEEAHYKELYEQGLQIIDALNKLIDNTKVPSEDEIMKKVLLFFEREKYFFDNKLTEKDSTAVLNELDRLRDEIISYMKGEQK